MTCAGQNWGVSITVSVPSEEFVDRLGELSDDVELVVWDFGLPQPEYSIDLAVYPYTTSPAILRVLPELDPQRINAIQSQSLGYDGVAEALPAGITFCNAVGVHEGSTAELAMALMLADLRNIDDAARAMPEGRWEKGEQPGLRDKTVLIIGYGGIGQAVEQRLSGFETHIVRCAMHARADPKVHGTDALNRLLPDADVAVLAVPLTDATTRMVDDEFLEAMKPGALLINVSRGRVADTDALVRHASEGRVRLALDVTDPEPLPPDHPLWTTPGVLVTPHYGGVVPSRKPRVDQLVVEQLDRLRNNRPLEHIVVQ